MANEYAGESGGWEAGMDCLSQRFVVIDMQV